MRKISFLLLFVLPLLLVGQKDQGVITYAQKVNLHMGLGEGNEQMKAMLPEFQTSKYELLFNSKVTLYRSIKEKPLEINEETHDGAQVMIRMEGPQSTIYTDLSSSDQVEMRDFIGKQYLISGATERKWKMTGETKEVLGYNCQKATLEEADRQVEAWFTTELAIPSGPATYGQLPGLILEINADGGRMLLVAENIEFKALEAEVMAAPTKGKKITRKKYQKLEEERLREMNAQGGGGVRMIIKTEEN